MIAKVGSVLKGFNVHRLDGRIERHNTPIHNYFAGALNTLVWFLTNGNPTAISISAPRYLGICEHASSRLLSGVGGGDLAFNTSTNQLTNVDVFFNGSGAENFNGTYVTSTGEVAFDVSGNTGSAFVNLSNNSFGDITGKRIYQYGNTTVATEWATSAVDAVRVATYVNGVYQSVNSEVQVLTVAANRTVRSIRFAGSTGASSTIFSIFDLATPLTLLTGESVSVTPGDFVATFTFDEYQPRVFTAPNCPIAGISASGRFQRLLPTFMDSGLAFLETAISVADARIWLMADANKIAIGNMPSNTLIEDDIIAAPIEVITPSRNAVLPAASNDWTGTMNLWGQVAVGGLTKQIIAGRTAANQPLAWVIEFDTPQDIPVDKVLAFSSTYQIVPDIVIPTYLTNP